jgi:peptidoglycan/xylan/chitin deacetylase (PgdA/CDA1 family)
MQRWITIMLLVIFFVSGCAQGPKYEEHPQSDTTPQPESVVQPPAATPDETEEPLETDGEIDQESEEEPEVKIAYYMNEIYDIKPIDEETEKNVVLLTFDDGPKEEEMLTSMLNTLKKHDAKAIFFVNGFRVQANPELLELIHSEGHAIGNHSWDHINLKNESEDSIRQQVDDVQQIVEETIGERPVFFRPPHGASNEFLREYVKQQGMLFMTWSNGSLDWDSRSQTPEAVIANVMDQLRPGSNILMHELPWTAEALDELLTRLKDEGYSFVNPHSIRIEADADSA